MVINNFNKSKIKILLDTEDLRNANIPLNNWIISPTRELK